MTLNIEQEDEEVAVNCIEQQTKLKSQLFVPMLVGTKSVRFQVDTGATCNVV